MSRYLTTISFTFVLILVGAEAVAAQTASRVIRLIDQRCANCHRNPSADRRADVEAPRVADTSTDGPGDNSSSDYKGAMRVHAEGVADDVKRAMAEFISGRKLAPLAAGDARNMPNRCTSKVPMRDIAAGPVWNGWSLTPQIHDSIARPVCRPAMPPRRLLKWAFGFPGVSSGQPMWQADACRGVDTGCVYALDAASGCRLVLPGRNRRAGRSTLDPRPPTVRPAQGWRCTSRASGCGLLRRHPRQRVSVDANTGELLWKVNADPHPLAAITGSPTL